MKLSCLSSSFPNTRSSWEIIYRSTCRRATCARRKWSQLRRRSLCRWTRSLCEVWISWWSSTLSLRCTVEHLNTPDFTKHAKTQRYSSKTVWQKTVCSFQNQEKVRTLTTFIKQNHCVLPSGPPQFNRSFMSSVCLLTSGSRLKEEWKWRHRRRKNKDEEEWEWRLILRRVAGYDEHKTRMRWHWPVLLSAVWSV